MSVGRPDSAAPTATRNATVTFSGSSRPVVKLMTALPGMDVPPLVHGPWDRPGEDHTLRRGHAVAVPSNYGISAIGLASRIAPSVHEAGREVVAQQGDLPVTDAEDLHQRDRRAPRRPV